MVSRVSSQPPVVRLTVRLGQTRGWKVYTLGPADAHGWRLVVDVFKAPSKQAPSKRQATVIALDAGHGGTETGGRGVRTGAAEKAINLGIARAAADYLQQAGIRTVLTRSTDKTVSLAARVARANSAGSGCLPQHPQQLHARQ